MTHFHWWVWYAFGLVTGGFLVYTTVMFRLKHLQEKTDNIAEKLMRDNDRLLTIIEKELRQPTQTPYTHRPATD